MTDTALLAHLQQQHAGKSAAASRQALAAHFGCHDRRVREAVERLREAGHPIGAVPKTGGYYYGSHDEQRDVLAEYDKSLYRRLQIRNRMARNLLGATGLQLVLVDEAGQAQLLT